MARDELRRWLWPDDVFVDFDNNLNITIARLRQALHDSADDPRFIETVPKYGYRFLTTTEVVPATSIAAVRRRIVVLPFVNLSSDADQECLCDAITDELITALAGLFPERLAVIARTTAMYYKKQHKDVARIGRELAVNYVVEGALRRSQDRIGINIQLIQTSDQSHLFAGRYDVALNEMSSIEHRLAHDVAAHLPDTAEQIRTGQPTSDHIVGKPKTGDLVAYNFYLLGRQQIQQCSPDPASAGLKALQYFEAALTRDPQFALAHAGLAEVYWWAGFLGFERPRVAFAAGVAAAARAVESDPTLGYAHALLGVFHSYLDYNWGEAQRELTLAQQLDPGNPEIQFRYADAYLLPQGRISEAISELERALQCDPLSMFYRFWLAYAFWRERKYDRALEECRFLIDSAPSEHVELTRALDLGYLGMGLVRTAQGRLDEAIPALRRALELSNGLPARVGPLGVALARNGKTDEARTLLGDAEAMAVKGYFPAASIACIHLALGDIDAAFTWLERAVEERDPNVVGINTYPGMEPIRTHPRFTALLHKMNLNT